LSCALPSWVSPWASASCIPQSDIPIVFSAAQNIRPLLAGSRDPFCLEHVTRNSACSTSYCRWACQKYPTFCLLTGRRWISNHVFPLLVHSSHRIRSFYTWVPLNSLLEMLCGVSWFESQQVASCLPYLGSRIPCKYFARRTTRGSWKWVSGLMHITSELAISIYRCPLAQQLHLFFSLQPFPS